MVHVCVFIYICIYIYYTEDSQELEPGCKMIDAGVPSFFGLGLEDGIVPTVWLLL